MSNIVVRAISPGRWSIGPNKKGDKLKFAKDVPGNDHDSNFGFVVNRFKELLSERGFPVPDRMEFFPVSPSGHGAPCDWFQAEFPSKLRPEETSVARRAGLEDIAQYLAVV